MSKMMGNMPDMSKMMENMPDMSKMMGDMPDMSSMMGNMPDMSSMMGNMPDMSAMMEDMPDMSSMTGIPDTTTTLEPTNLPELNMQLPKGHSEDITRMPETIDLPDMTAIMTNSPAVATATVPDTVIQSPGNSKSPIWKQFISNMVPVITRVVKFCKRIPGTYNKSII